MINRDDMLELTRRMTLERSNFSRIAGCYVDEEGFIEGTFNTSFLKLDSVEKQKKLEVAKAVPFAKPNQELFSYEIPLPAGKDDIFLLLEGIKTAELKNDALLDVFYELVTEKLNQEGFAGKEYGIFVYYSAYDIPSKGADHASQWESEEVYKHIIVALAEVDSDYEAGRVLGGFLFPSFANRSEDRDHIALLEKAEEPLMQQALLKLLRIK